MAGSTRNRARGSLLKGQRHAVKKKILIIDENGTVPHDTRVWREAVALREAGYEVTTLCPRGQGRDSHGYEVIDGIHIYRHPMPPEAN